MMKNVAVFRDVAASLVNSIVTTEGEYKNLSKAEEIVRGIAFDEFDEHSTCQVLRGIKLNDFETVVERIASRHSLDNGKKDEILDGQFAQGNGATNRHFVFNVGETGQVVFCKVATVKTTNETIDLAIVSYKLKFKFSADRIEQKRTRWLLGFVPRGTVTSYEYEPRNLSERDQNGFSQFFRVKALNAFLDEYPRAAAGYQKIGSR